MDFLVGSELAEADVAGADVDAVGLGVVEVAAGVLDAGADACVVGACVTGACVVGDRGGCGFADAVASCSGSHDLSLAVAAVLAAAVLVPAARLIPEAAVSRTLPVISVTVAGRARAKRMKRPTSAARYCYGTTHSVWSSFMG